MAVAVQIDIPNWSQRQYQQAAAAILPDGKLPGGWLLHIAGPTKGGWRVINVVPSPDQFDGFFGDDFVAAAERSENAMPQVTTFAIDTLLQQR
ncbi:MAG TPA: hypothetical protein VG412_07315 [Acidimicrobiales bacterium]|nr:hypothetical protein [Acidimicrobiales bacterium]